MRNVRSEQLEFNDSVDRILKGIDLKKNNRVKYLIISGGEGSLIQKGRSEAMLLERFAESMGILKDDILLDTSSKNTYENALNTLNILDEKRIKKTVLITSAFHMFRADGCFRKVGIEAHLLPVDYNSSLEIPDFRYFLPSSDALTESNRFIHESIGIIIYGITGKAKYM